MRIGPKVSGAGMKVGGGFTLIEIMIVVSIMAIAMTMSVPIVYKVWHKAPMRKAVADVVEVCSNARARAILTGSDTTVVFHPREGGFGLGAGPAPKTDGSGPKITVKDSGANLPAIAPSQSGSGLSGHLGDQVIIYLLDINMSGIEYRDAESATVRFHPNGTADEMKMILFDGKEYIGIETEITTGLVNVVPNPLQEWTRR